MLGHAATIPRDAAVSRPRAPKLQHVEPIDIRDDTHLSEGEAFADKPRPREFDADAALERAMQVFWCKGYEGTSLDELCDAMALSRSSVYAAFGDKRALLLRALDHYTTRGSDRILKNLTSGKPIRKTLAALLDHFIAAIVAGPGRRGCFFGNCAAELPRDDRDAMAVVQRALERNEDHFRAALDGAQARGELRRDADTRALARFLTASIQGLRLVGKAKPDRGIAGRGGDDTELSRLVVETSLGSGWEESMLELYHHGTSVCAANARIILAEKGPAWTGHYVDILKGEQFAPEYLKLNPKHVVSTLVHDGHVIRESTVMGEYIDDAFPEPPLKPDAPLDCATMRIWTKRLDEELHPATGIDRCESALADEPWLAGTIYTLADIAILPYIFAFREVRPELMTSHPETADWYARIMARPAVKATYEPSAETMPAS